MPPQPHACSISGPGTKGTGNLLYNGGRTVVHRMACVASLSGRRYMYVGKPRRQEARLRSCGYTRAGKGGAAPPPPLPGRACREQGRARRDTKDAAGGAARRGSTARRRGVGHSPETRASSGRAPPVCRLRASQPRAADWRRCATPRAAARPAGRAAGHAFSIAPRERLANLARAAAAARGGTAARAVPAAPRWQPGGRDAARRVVAASERGARREKGGWGVRWRSEEMCYTFGYVFLAAKRAPDWEISCQDTRRSAVKTPKKSTFPPPSKPRFHFSRPRAPAHSAPSGPRAPLGPGPRPPRFPTRPHLRARPRPTFRFQSPGPGHPARAPRVPLSHTSPLHHRPHISKNQETR